jgi:8-oxo-dGTP pyrophosphatase MutT (NUDIX family)
MTREGVLARLRAKGLFVGAMPEVASLAQRSDFDLHPGGGPGFLGERVLKAAGVLVPLIDRPGGVTVLLTQRTDHLQKHAGQISFPGGGREPADPHIQATALRETQEEIGLAPEHVEVLGQLDVYETTSAYAVTPVIGWIHPPFTLTVDPFEVKEAFEVPLSFILDPANHVRERRVRDGMERHFWVLPYEQRYIWGATAGMLVNLYEVLCE